MKLLAFILFMFSLVGFAPPKKNKSYMNNLELRVIEMLNEVRKDPKGFEKNIIRPLMLKDPSSEYLKSLSVDLLKIKDKLPMLAPDSAQTVGARCHAKEIGQKGLVTHTRQTKSCQSLVSYYGECISFGPDKAEDILLLLLIDEGIVGVGHRVICLSSGYTKLGVAIEPHTTYRHCAVLDFN